jgi:hypothetical protein
VSEKKSGGGTFKHERKKVSGKTGGRKWERRNVGEGGKRMKRRKKEGGNKYTRK